MGRCRCHVAFRNQVHIAPVKISGRSANNLIDYSLKTWAHPHQSSRVADDSITQLELAPLNVMLAIVLSTGNLGGSHQVHVTVTPAYTPLGIAATRNTQAFHRALRRQLHVEKVP